MAQDLPALGQSVRAAREARGMSIEELGHTICRLFPDRKHLPEVRAMRIASCERVESLSVGMLTLELLEEIAVALAVPSEVSDGWFAYFGRLPSSLCSAILEHPERWAAIRAVLDGSVGWMIAGEVRAECARAEVLHGAGSASRLPLATGQGDSWQRYAVPSEFEAKARCDSAFIRGECSGLHVLIEEVCEAVAAGIAEDEPAARAELVQVAAAAVGLIQAIDERAKATRPGAT